MKAITIWQPWASLIAVGVKTIETRSWPAPKRLVGQRIAIHAAAQDPGNCFNVGTWTCVTGEPIAQGKRAIITGYPGSERLIELPLGAVVASAVLADCVPIVHDPEDAKAPFAIATAHGDVHVLTADYYQRDHVGQAPYGDFAPGRWAWLLEDGKPTTERCPYGCKADSDPEDVFEDGTPIYRVPSGAPVIAHGTALTMYVTCPVCSGKGSCDPVPAKGRQRVWEWTP